MAKRKASDTTKRKASSGDTTKRKASSGDAQKRKDFQWTDDEAELLLSVTHEYKVKKSVEECVDWESVKSKYDDILALFHEALPSSPEESAGKDYPHEKSEITKGILTTKLKNVRLKFRQAVDAGRRSGHGRVVLLYYELCERIWGGSPATQQIDGGMESVDISELSELTHPDLDSPLNSGNDTSTEAEHPEHQSNAQPLLDVSVQKRRKLLDEKLKSHKQEKLKRKLPVDIQLLSCAQEELKIKQRLVDQMDQMEKHYSDNMLRLSSNMEKLTQSISDGFSVLNVLLGHQQPQYSYPPKPPPSYPFYPSTLPSTSMVHSPSPSSPCGPPFAEPQDH